MRKIKLILIFIISILKQLPLRFVELISQIFPENTPGCKIRGYLYKPFFKRCGKNFQVGLAVKLEYLNNIVIGDNVYIGHNSWISGLNGGVTIGDEVMFGPFVKMISSNHTFENGSARFAKSIGSPIKVGYGSWIAANVTVTAGVEIGKSCLIAAGTVLTKSFPDNSIVAGVPGKIINKQLN